MAHEIEVSHGRILDIFVCPASLAGDRVDDHLDSTVGAQRGRMCVMVPAVGKLSDHWGMAKAKSISHQSATGQLVQGRAVATLGRGLSLVKVGRATKAMVRPEDKTTVLIQKTARALSKPGIDKAVVFRGPNAAKIFSYSVYTPDPTKVIREASDGSRAIGRLVAGKFRVIAQ